MSLSAMAWAKRQTAGGVAAKAVLMTLADYADEAGTCWPSQALIARETELTERSVRDQLAKLEEAGLVSREERRRRDGTQASDRFFLPINSRNEIPADRNDVPNHADDNRNDVPQQPEPRSALTTFDPPTDPPLSEAKASSMRVRSGASAFDTWWAAYPHKIGKGDAERKFAAALKTTPLDELLAGIERYRAAKPPDRAWCNPATWLHQRRWTDQPAELTEPHERHHPHRPAASPFGGDSRTHARRIGAALALERRGC